MNRQGLVCALGGGLHVLKVGDQGIGESLEYKTDRKTKYGEVLRVLWKMLLSFSSTLMPHTLPSDTGM